MTPRGLRLWLVRHARVQVAPGVCYGASDVAADAAHTAQVAAQLAPVLPRGAALRTSMLQRCEHLTTALCGLRPDLIKKTDPRVSEMDFGAWEGRRWADIARPELDTWTAHFADHACGGGESVRQLMQRVGAALRDTRAQPGPAVWVTHAGVIRAVQLLHRGVACPTRMDQWPRRGPAFGEWCELVW